MQRASRGSEPPAVGGQAPARRPIRLAIADSRALIALALGGVLGTQADVVVAATGATDVGVLAEFIAAEPDVVLIGSGTHVAEAIRFASAARRLMPAIGIVLLADALEAALVQFALVDPFSGLLLTDAGADEIASCLQQVMRGRTVLPSGWQQVCAADGRNPLAALSERQAEVLELLADGLSYGEIAARLFISVNTVKFHVKAIFLALGVSNRTAASRFLSSHPR